MSAASPFAQAGRRGAVVAGFDGSDRAWEAVHWAAAEAAHRRRPLLLVHAHLASVTSAWGTVAAPGWGAAAVFDNTPLLREAEEQLLMAAEVCRRGEPGLDVSVEVLEGRTSAVLTEVARSVQAELVVVGTSGQWALSRVLLGSKATDLAHDVDVPVVAVRSGPADRSGPVVVAVNGTAECMTAVQFAASQAERHSCELRPVHEDSRMLLDHSEGARLLVVSDHGDSAVQRALFGSVIRTALTRAPCPVAVVPKAATAGP
ncbi:Nucleotide-binding universal stress protein, UspA family [Lentzea fradiae]|uniref:Nucleotide-binding universal stress protein, UspA family n=1 Tax=Lentzea fradiae TaxID=200378 RepID=A0A1G7W212_9PSEU|nr:universal stress protein [Lentzea fradiae]SDG65918.1 Nucleotide-binding universal stress protein, UspA family [Lentzea fradiae]